MRENKRFKTHGYYILLYWFWSVSLEQTLSLPFNSSVSLAKNNNTQLAKMPVVNNGNGTANRTEWKSQHIFSLDTSLNNSIKVLELEAFMHQENNTEPGDFEKIAVYIPLCDDVHLPQDTGENCSSCNGRCGKVSDGCYCDSDCLFYKDCCRDFHVFCAETASMETLPAATARGRTRCSPVMLAISPFLFDNGYHTTQMNVVSSCGEENYEPSICTQTRESLDTALPVTDRRTGVTYTRRECATCNGVPSSDMVAWGMDLECAYTSMDLKNLTNARDPNALLQLWKVVTDISSDCAIYFRPPSGFSPRFCSFSPFQNIISSCSLDSNCKNTLLEAACHSEEYNPVTSLMTNTFTYMKFRNSYCFYCNGIGSLAECDYFDELPPITCALPPYMYDYDNQIESVEPSELLFLSDPGPGSFSVLSMRLLFDINMEHGLRVGETLETDCTDIVEPPLTPTRINASARSHDVCISAMMNSSAPVTLAELLGNITRLSSVLIADVKELDTIWSMNISFIPKLSIGNITNLSQSDFVENITSNYLQLQNLTISKITNASDSSCLTTESTGLCRSINRNGSDSKPQSLFEPTVGRYIFMEYNMYVCPDSQTARSVSDLFSDELLGKVTLGAMVVSLASLFLYFVLCCVAPCQSAKSALGLAVSLSVAQTAFLLSPLVVRWKVACYLVAALVHWGFLATFSWMSVLAVDLLTLMYYSFKLKTVDEETRKHCIYIKCSVAISVPSVIVLVAVAIDLTNATPIFENIYAAPVCLISHRLATLVFFFIPAVVSFSVTGVAICVAALLLCMINKGSSLTKPKRILRVVLKMFMLTGITWCLAFVAVPTGNLVLLIIFILLNGSQGLALLITAGIPRTARKKVSSFFLRSTGGRSTQTTSL